MKSIVERARTILVASNDRRTTVLPAGTLEFMAQAVIDFVEALEDIRTHSAEPFVSVRWANYVYEVAIEILRKHGVKVGDDNGK